MNKFYTCLHFLWRYSSLIKIKLPFRRVILEDYKKKCVFDIFWGPRPILNKPAADVGTPLVHTK